MFHNTLAVVRANMGTPSNQWHYNIDGGRRVGGSRVAHQPPKINQPKLLVISRWDPIEQHNNRRAAGTTHCTNINVCVRRVAVNRMSERCNAANLPYRTCSNVRHTIKRRYTNVINVPRTYRGTRITESRPQYPGEATSTTTTTTANMKRKPFSPAPSRSTRPWPFIHPSNRPSFYTGRHTHS